jgi:demethylmenaquinone methyltransferase/2-methoxy-6-polyprenyl-1,4-benzoquinol methylase
MTHSPKLAMQEYIGSKEKKQVYVNQMFATIAPRYDLVTTLLSFGQDRHWKRKLVELAALEPQHRVLDLACGTGDITFLLAERVTDGQVIGVDITPGMIEIARRKLRPNEAKIRFEVADIMHLNFPECFFDRITVGYGVRNAPDIAELFSEIFRLLKPGGRFLSLDFGKPAHWLYRRAYLRYLAAIGSTLGWLLHRDPDVYRYISESIKLYPGQEGVKNMLEDAGFVECGLVSFLRGALAINFGRKP